MSSVFLIIFVLSLAVWAIFKLLNHGGKGNYNRNTDNYNRGANNHAGDSENKRKAPKSISFSLFGTKNKEKEYKPSLFSDWFYPTLIYDKEAISWCANLFALDSGELKSILRDMQGQYKRFRIGKRSGGYRTISAPNGQLRAIQKTIYYKLLLPVNIHPAATGFRKNVSIVDNAKPHLGKNCVLKTDIIDFFGSIHQYDVARAFEKIGYPTNISELLAELCCLRKRLPQGAPTSPALSNIIAYDMDRALIDMAKEHGLTYTRYADDMTFSGDAIDQEKLFPKIAKIVRKNGFALKLKKTRFMDKNKRKIITGISISSGEKLTIPKAKKREVRKNVHYILTKGLAGHQRHIKSTDPAYLKRIIGYLNFWHSVEPENQYVIDSINSLKKLEK